MEDGDSRQFDGDVSLRSIAHRNRVRFFAEITALIVEHIATVQFGCRRSCIQISNMRYKKGGRDIYLSAPNASSMTRSNELVSSLVSIKFCP